MALYKEQSETGTITQWNRARQIVLDNPIDAPPSAMIYEALAKRYPDGSTSEATINSHSYTLDDPTVEIPIIDPDTYEPTEVTFPAGQFYLLAASVALWLMRG